MLASCSGFAPVLHDCISYPTSSGNARPRADVSFNGWISTSEIASFQSRYHQHGLIAESDAVGGLLRLSEQNIESFLVRCDKMKKEGNMTIRVRQNYYHMIVFIYTTQIGSSPNAAVERATPYIGT